MKRIFCEELNPPRWVWMARQGPQVWVHDLGQTDSFPFEKRKTAGGTSHSGAEGSLDNRELKAPMPGKITKIFKDPGQSVLASEAVLVMEAMKMEYTLKFSIDGVLESLAVKVGQQVNLNDTLAILAESSLATQGKPASQNPPSPTSSTGDSSKK